MEPDVEWILIEPKFDEPTKGNKAFASDLSPLVGGTKRARTSTLSGRDAGVLALAGDVIRDLFAQGWRVRIEKGRVEIAQPLKEALRTAEKERVRVQLHQERDEQLKELPVRSFIRDMEKARLHNGRFVSIFSLMRDGESLAAALRAARVSSAPDAALADAVKPYLEVVTDGNCPHTGLRLIDVWRYFRHTWAKAHRSIPGRTMMLMIRDAAAPFHPIIGIAALSSPAVQIGVRDRWIGWHPEVFIDDAHRSPSAEHLAWLLSSIADAMRDLYVDDFLTDGLVTPDKLHAPDAAVLAALEAESRERRIEHHRFADSSELKREVPDDEWGEQDWLKRTATDLFRSKRAKLLAQLLRARIVVAEAQRGRDPASAVSHLTGTPEGRQVLSDVVRKVKADRVGISVADLTVCGAIAPYNEILGGKLVSMVMASPEVAVAYRARYASAKSVIASSMAGRPITRSPALVLIGTTSLYGSGSSQYNRLKMPVTAAGGIGAHQIEYIDLGHTEGFGTLQFSRATIDALANFAAQSEHGQRVNSIFGEGTNPRLRKVRQALDHLGLPSERLLNHGSPRVVYAIPLAENFRDYLLGLSTAPKYYLPLSDPTAATKGIVSWWRRRWLQGRVERDDVLARVQGNRMRGQSPNGHGAVVTLPRVQEEEEEQLALFDER